METAKPILSILDATSLDSTTPCTPCLLSIGPPSRVDGSVGLIKRSAPTFDCHIGWTPCPSKPQTYAFGIAGQDDFLAVGKRVTLRKLNRGMRGSRRHLPANLKSARSGFVVVDDRRAYSVALPCSWLLYPSRYRFGLCTCPLFRKL